MTHSNEPEKSLITVSRALIFLTLLFIIAIIIFVAVFFDFGSGGKKDIAKTTAPASQPSAPAAAPAAEVKKFSAPVWKAPEESSLPKGKERDVILYGRELIAHTSKYLGPRGKVAQMSNGMNCQNCHLDAGTKAWGNNYSAVYSTYPKFRARSGTSETIVKRINDCFERSLNGKPLDSTSKEMKAMIAYMKWLGTGIQKGETPAGAGLQKLAYLQRAADPKRGAAVYSTKCASCHGKNGEGIPHPQEAEFLYPPLWGKNSYNDGAGLYRISNFAGYVKANMPFGVTHESPQLTDEEAWDVAAYVNSRPRPHKDQSTDWKDISKKPIDYPFGPYADKFTALQHKFGPFKPIADFYKK